MLHGIRRAYSLVVGAIVASRGPAPPQGKSAPLCQPELYVVIGAASLGDGGPGSELALRGDGLQWRSGTEEELRAIARRQTEQARRVTRAKMVLGVVFERRGIAGVARELDKTRATVRLWVGRFRGQCSLEALEDMPRSGRPAWLGRMMTRERRCLQRRDKRTGLSARSGVPGVSILPGIRLDAISRSRHALEIVHSASF